MTTPTTAQIQADVALPTFTVELYDAGTTTWVDVSADVVQVSGDYTITAGGAGDGIGFGLARAPTQTIEVAREAYDEAWDRRPVRISLGFAGSNPLHFVGLIDGRDRDGPQGAWAAVGWQELVAAVGEIRTPLLRRVAAFTATTASSVEDPSDPAYAGGLGNRILWAAGGRPLEQAATYPAAVFYYSTQGAILAPEWSWLNGGDPAQALDELCRVAGGTLYQDTAGVVRYVEPYRLSPPSGDVIHYTDSAAAAVQSARVTNGLRQYGPRPREQSRPRRLVPSVVRASFVTRRLQTPQVMFKVSEPRIDGKDDGLIAAGAAAQTVTLDLERPALVLTEARVTAVILGTPDAAPADQLTVVATLVAAQRVTVQVTNLTGQAILLASITLLGRPLVAGEEATVKAGTPTTYGRELTVQDSVYLTDRAYAERLCSLYLGFYGTARPTVELSGCGFDPTTTLGQRVLFTSADLGIDAQPYRVVGIRPSRTGVEMALTLAPIAGLPVAADFFTIGQTYAASDERELSY